MGGEERIQLDSVYAVICDALRAGIPAAAIIAELQSAIYHFGSCRQILTGEVPRLSWTGEKLNG
jgi:hypothetical protein